ncbi:SOUL family heme-binding protein [Tabrizicola sp.]|uniref:SOUL family heme-binding protein n=1 Tax=Tabrizicola sp. TaxID=2005166 RepID=UPI003F3F81D9
MRKVVLAAGLGVAMVVGVAKAESYKGYEMPPYTVEATEGAYELRSYGSHLVAEVRVSGSRDGAISAGFRVLAGYIFGGNDRGEKIAMTVPVAQTPVSDGEWTVRFMMPSAFRPADLPSPEAASIRFVTVDPERQVALSFSGARGDRVLAAKAAELRAWAKERGLTITAGPHYYFYDGPMTLPWNRRNEVAFTVD